MHRHGSFPSPLLRARTGVRQQPAAPPDQPHYPDSSRTVCHSRSGLMRTGSPPSHQDRRAGTQCCAAPLASQGDHFSEWRSLLVSTRGDSKDNTSVRARCTVFRLPPSVTSSRYPQTRYSAVLCLLVPNMPWKRKMTWTADAWCRLDSRFAQQFGSERALGSPEALISRDDESSEDDRPFLPRFLPQEIIFAHRPIRRGLSQLAMPAGESSMQIRLASLARVGRENARSSRYGNSLPILGAVCANIFTAGEPPRRVGPCQPQCFSPNSAGSQIQCLGLGAWAEQTVYLRLASGSGAQNCCKAAHQPSVLFVSLVYALPLRACVNMVTAERPAKDAFVVVQNNRNLTTLPLVSVQTSWINCPIAVSRFKNQQVQSLHVVASQAVGSRCSGTEPPREELARAGRSLGAQHGRAPHNPGRSRGAPRFRRDGARWLGQTAPEHRLSPTQPCGAPKRDRRRSALLTPLPCLHITTSLHAPHHPNF